MSSVTASVPGTKTRPMSLRHRSTSITCSAISFSSVFSASTAGPSIAGSPRRGAVPASARITIRRPSSRNSTSGLAPISVCPPSVVRYM